MNEKLAMIMCSVIQWVWYKWDCQCYGLPFTSYGDYWDFKQEEFLKAIREWLNLK